MSAARHRPAGQVHPGLRLTLLELEPAAETLPPIAGGGPSYTTTIISNGFSRAASTAEYLASLHELLRTRPLRRGPLDCPTGVARLRQGQPTTVDFMGDFENLCHVFHIRTDDPAVIDALAEALIENARRFPWGDTTDPGDDPDDPVPPDGDDPELVARRAAYQARREARVERLRARAAQAMQRSDAAFARSNAAVEGIPFGQPILIGHHSEKRHRAALAKSHRAMDAFCAERKNARELESRADAAEENTAIQTENPDAVSLLREKLTELEAKRALYNAVNRAHTRFLKKPATLDTAELPDAWKATIRAYQPEYSWTPHPIAPYQVQNLGKEIARVKQRIDEVARIQASAHKTERYGHVELIENPDTCRIQLVFPGKPDDATRTRLKRHGFRWAPSEGAWQRQLNASGRYAARQVLRELGLEPTTDAAANPENSPENSDLSS